MKIEKKDLGKSQFELMVEMSAEELKPYIEQGAKQVAREVKIDGFRPGNVPYDILRQKIGDMTIWEEAANIAINKNLDKIFKDNLPQPAVGQPKVDITKLAPDNPLEFKIVVAVLPEIKLGEYKDLKIKRKKVEVSDEEAVKIINDLREMRVKEVLVERAIADKDKVLVDIEMFLDKVPVEGGQGKDAAIIVGKDYVVPGFDKKLIGAKKDDVREFELPYPDNFHMKNLAGKMVDFRAKVKEVYARELPELNDEFATGFGLKKIEELKENVQKSVVAQKEKEAEQVLEKEILEKILEKTRINDLPELLIEHESHNMVHELEHTITDQGGKFEDYLASLNKTHDQLMLDLLPEAVKRVKVSLLIREIGTKEKIKVEEVEIDEHIKEMKKHYHDQVDVLGKLDTEEYRDYVYNVFSSRKVIEKLIEWNVGK
jgi:trigger factor